MAATVAIIIGGAIANALTFSGSNFLSKRSINKEWKRHDKAMEDMQRAQIKWAKKRQE